MELIRESMAYNLLNRLMACLRQGYVNELCGKFSLWIKRIWACSATTRVLSRQGRLASGWAHSMAYSILTWLFNAIPWVCRKIYEPVKGLWDKSAIMRALWYCGDSTPVLLSWFFLALLVIPQEYWNNAYSFAAMVLIFAVYSVSLMRNKSARVELKV